MNTLNGIAIVCLVGSALVASTPQTKDALPPLIVPRRMQAQFSLERSSMLWTDSLYSPSKSNLYVLSLEPEVDVGKHVIGIDLVLRDAKKPKAGENLLNPSGKWHGLQPYSFTARDLLDGADRSAFGAHRTITVTSEGLDIRIHVLDVSVNTLLDGTHQIDKLSLSISAENLHNF
jgi:hypothetical protein